MSGPAQQIQALADELEKHVCDQLKKSRPAGVLRRMKVNQLVNNAGRAGEVRFSSHVALVESNAEIVQAEYNQACSYFADNAASTAGFDAALTRLQSRG